MERTVKRILFFLLVLGIPLKAAAINIIENFDDIKRFRQNKAAKAEMKLSEEKGVEGKAVKIEFDITDDHFVEIGAPVKFDLAEAEEFVWKVKGTASGCLIEIKFVDADGSTYGKKMPLSGLDPDKWKEMRLSKRECHYMWGGDKNVDEIKELWIALSRGVPQAAYIVIDELGFVKKKKGMPEMILSLNQTGYRPFDRKHFVVRVYDTAEKDVISGSYRILEKQGKKEKEVYSGKLEKTGFKDWSGVFLSGDFSEVENGTGLTAEAEIVLAKGKKKVISAPFSIENTVISRDAIPKQFEYLGYQRCGIRCHKSDPVPGGWHDTLFDISKRTWSIPSLMYGLARYVKYGQYHPENTPSPLLVERSHPFLPKGELGKDEKLAEENKITDDMAELIWGLKYITMLPEPDGSVSWGGIEADFKKYMTYEEFISRLGPLKPEDDHIPRIKYTEPDYFATAFTLVALLDSAAAVREVEPGLAEEAVNLAKKQWLWLDKKDNLSESREYGTYLWCASELFRATGDREYLKKVPELLPKLLFLQALNFNDFENYACGDFFQSENIRNFKFQYKYVSFNIAINLALLNLLKILRVSDSLWFDVYYANRVFAENHIKRLSSFTPYGQIAAGVEQSGGKFTKNYFAGPEAREVAADNHGLNCDMLGKAYIALKSGQYFEDLELEAFADNQLDWVFGLNPLDYCMAMGSGKKNPVIMAAYSGKPELPGIIPNGLVGGNNEEPEWWGDGPSSGEDWLPHNAAFFLLMSEIENPASLSVVVTGKAGAEVKIMRKNALIDKKAADDKGMVIFKNLSPQTEYEVFATSEGKTVSKKVVLLSGSEKNISLDIERDVKIELEALSSPGAEKEFTVRASFKNLQENEEYLLRLKGCRAKDEDKVSGAITGDKMEFSVIADGKTPLLFRIEIKNRPDEKAELYLPGY